MNWKSNSIKIREKILRISHKCNIPHLASSLSCVDILTVLYDTILGLNKSNINALNRNRFILSKGHAATALYSTLNHLGFISNKDLYTVGKKINLHNSAISWLKKNHFIDHSESPINKDNVFFLDTIEKKINQIQKLKCLYFIDDLTFILNLLPKDIKKILFLPEDNISLSKENDLLTLKNWKYIKDIINV